MEAVSHTDKANKTEILSITGAVTVYLPGGLGAWNRHEMRNLRVMVGPYAQYKRAYFLYFTPKGKRNPRALVLTYMPQGLVAEGHGLPECPDAFAPAVAVGNGVSISQGRRMSCDPGWDSEARAALAGVSVVLDLEADAKANA